MVLSTLSPPLLKKKTREGKVREKGRLKEFCEIKE